MSFYSPEQREAMQRTVGETAPQAAAILQAPVEKIEGFLQRVSDFIKRSLRIIGDRPYLLLLIRSDTKGKELTAGEAFKYLRDGKAVLCVDYGFRLVKAEVGSMRLVDCGNKTEQEGTLGVMVWGSYKYDILVGKIIDEENVSHPGAGPLGSSKFHHPIADFEMLARDHKENCIDRERAVRYWANRKRRILLAKPDCTESIFHLSLFFWLKVFVIDKLKILGETIGLGQDKTDIEVVTVEGTYLIEMKWLGENENGTKNEEPVITGGLAQVRTYLENDIDRHFVCAHLVVYDARPLEIHQTHSRYDDSQRHGLCSPPHIFFLESDTPSEIGKRIARRTA